MIYKIWHNDDIQINDLWHKHIQDWRWTQIMISFSSLFCAYKWFFCDLKSDAMMTYMKFIGPTMSAFLRPLKHIVCCVNIGGIYHIFENRHLAHWLHITKTHVSFIGWSLNNSHFFIFLICHTQVWYEIYVDTESSHASYHSQPDTLMTFFNIL